MARPKKVVEVPGQETKAADTTLENSLAGNTADLPEVTKPANTAAELNAATAGATVITESTAPIVGTDPGQGDYTAAATVDLTARNAALSELNAAGFAIITKFEAYGFVDEIGNPLTNNLDFIDLVKAATMPVATIATLRGRAAAMVVNEDGAKHVAPGKPVLTADGWHIPG